MEWRRDLEPMTVLSEQLRDIQPLKLVRTEEKDRPFRCWLHCGDILLQGRLTELLLLQQFAEVRLL
jgi:hypothetical protein